MIKKRKTAKKLRELSCFLSLVMILQMFFVSGIFINNVYADGVPTLTINVKNKLDVALAVGTSDVNVSTFEQDLKNALAARGNVPAENINVSAVKASQVSVANNFNWWVYDHRNTNSSSSGNPKVAPTDTAYSMPYMNGSINQYVEDYLETDGNFDLNRHILATDNGQTMTMSGYGAPSYRDFMYMPNSASTKKTFEFKIQEISAFDALDGGGFFFNTNITGTYGSGQKMSGYLLFMQYNTSGKGSLLELYKFQDIDTKAFHNVDDGCTISSYPGFTLLATSNSYLSTDSWRKIKIEAYPTKVKMWYRGSSIEDNSDLADSELVNWTLNGGGSATEVPLPGYTGDKSYGFGPMIGYRSHGCNRQTQFKFKDLSMSTDTVKTLTEVVRQPEWHENTQKYIVNLNEEHISDFDDTQKVAEIISRLNNDDIYYVGWGSDINKQQSNDFLIRNNLKGTFVDIDDDASTAGGKYGDTAYKNQINKIADNVLERYNKNLGDGDSYVLTNDQVSFSTANAELNNTADENWPQGKWKVVQDTTGFDNSQGLYAYNNQYTSDLDVTFSKPGKYDIYYEDKKIKTVYAHEKPVANFDASVSGNNISYVDSSYDPDEKNQEGKGIAAEQWSYMDLTRGDTTWTIGQLTSVESGKNYIISLKVKDKFGQWSDEYTKQIYTGAAQVKPIADFDISSGNIIKNVGSQSINIEDKSYDPAGKTITTRNWTVTKDGNTYSKAITLPSTDFTDDPAGVYRISLNVVSNSGTSETITRLLNIIADSNAPTVTTTPSNGTFSMGKQITLNFSDIGGSYLQYQKYRVSDSTDVPSTGWSTESSNQSRTITLNSLGTFYIHYEANDNAGNILTGYSGPYIIIDNEKPTNPIITLKLEPDGSYTSNTWTDKSVSFNVYGSTDNSNSVIYEYSTDNLYWTQGAADSISATGSTTLFYRAKDNSGNLSDTQSVIIKISKKPSIITSTISAISDIGAIVAGNVGADVGADVTERGIEYKKSTDAVYTDVYASSGGLGSFSCKLTGLDSNVSYDVRTFATNAIGTSYGNVISFSTLLNDAQSVEADEADIDIKYASGDDQNSVTQDVYFTTATQNGSAIEWSSNNTSIISNSGIVIRPEYLQGDQNVTVTASVYKNDVHNAKVFNLVVKQKLPTDAQSLVKSDMDLLSIVYADGDNASNVTGTMYLPLIGTSGKTTVTWTSSDASIVTNTGSVKRPEVEGEDAYVTLRATIKDNATGTELAKDFKIKVIKLTENDAVKEAAKNLTISKAFIFEPGDTWEAVTMPFLAITAGDHGATITWQSDNDAITLTPGLDKTSAMVTRPQDNNKETILTATIKKGSAYITKTFMLVVQKTGVSKVETRNTTTRNASAEDLSSGNLQSFSVERSVLQDQTKIDYIKVDADKIIALTDEMNPQQAQNSVVISLPGDKNDKAQQLAIEVPATAVAAIADRNSSLVIKTDEASINLDSSVVKQMAQKGTDLFFRVVPINDTTEQAQAKDDAGKNGAVIKLVGNDKELNILGIPRKIETNYSGFNTEIILPLTGITIPEKGTQEFLDSLRIFVEHSDGTQELLVPTRIVKENGVATGVAFVISHFSRFQIVRAADKEVADIVPSTVPVSVPVPVDTKKGTKVTKDGNSLGDVYNVDETGSKITLYSSKIITSVKNGEDGDTIKIADNNKIQKLEVEMNAELIKEMQAKNDTLTIETSSAIWNIPANSISLDDLCNKLGKPSDLKDVKVKVTLSTIYQDNNKYGEIQSAVKKVGGELLVNPVDFKIQFTYDGKNVTVDKLNKYVNMLIPVKSGNTRITTGVYVNEDAKLSHVPTEVTIINNNYYAKINSLYGNGTHAVIWNPKEFADVENHWSKTETNNMGARTVVNGVDGNNYVPDRSITRAEFAAIVVRGLGLRPTDTKNPFTDVSDSAWYNDYIKTAVEFGLINGYGDGSFRPDKTITREEAMAIVARASKLTNLKTALNSGEATTILAAFSDNSKVASWAKDVVATCIKAAIISGRSSDTIAPKKQITRAETAAIINRLLQQSGLINK